MNHEHSSICAFVKKINTQFYLPAIQRKFVWKETQICELFDSVMREYPIGSFLVWHTNAEIRKRKFVENWTPKMPMASYFMSANSKEKSLVLDGQQRIQSFFIGLSGRIGKKSLFFNILSGNRNKVGSVIQKTLFAFEFMEKARDPNWVSLSKLIDDIRTESAIKIAKRVMASLTTAQRSEDSNDLIQENVNRLTKVFRTDAAISYQLLDSTDIANRYDENDVVEIFVRANSGGTKLQKSELLFALLSASWDSASQDLEELESDLADKGFVFSRDYFLKACLILLGKKAQYDVKKFRDTATLNELKTKWGLIRAAITDVVDFLPQFTPIANSKALPSKNALLPLIAYRYFQPNGWKSRPNKVLAAIYITRTSIASTYNGAKDDLLDALVIEFKSSKSIQLEKVFNAIQKKGRAITISRDQLFNIKYTNSRVPLIMKLLRSDLDYVASNKGNLPTVDHLISKKLLKAAGITEKDQVDQLANLVALSATENQNDKRAKPIAEWLSSTTTSADERAVLRDMLYLPTEEALWAADRYKEFIEARKKLIANVPAIKELLSEPAEARDDESEEGEEGEEGEES